MAERSDRLWRRLAAAAVIGLMIGIVVLLASVATGADLRPQLYVGLGITTGLLVQLVRETVSEPQQPDHLEPPERAGNDYLNKLRQFARRLEAASRDGSKYERNVRPALARLATERLRRRYGIDWAKQPVQAKEVLGEQLWSLTITTASAVPAPSHAQLSALAARIEEL
jgi:hypothetical protein